MRRRLSQLGFMILLAIPLAVILSSFTRDIILAAISQLVYVGRLLISRIPQIYFWILFISFSLYMFIRSLLKRKKLTHQASIGLKLHKGRVQALMQTLDRTSKGVYFKWRLAEYLLGLTIESLAYHERVSPGEIRHKLMDGRLSTPPKLLAYLRAGLTPVYSSPASLFTRIKQRLRPVVTTSPLDLDPEVVIQFLEEKLELIYDE